MDPWWVRWVHDERHTQVTEYENLTLYFDEDSEIEFMY